VSTHELDGRQVSAVALDRDVTLTALAYDAEKRELYAPLAREAALGVFDEAGHLVRTLPLPAGETLRFVDVGPRSLIRVF